MSRVFLVVMDSLGIGGAPDAAAYFNGSRSDVGANTLAHIVEATGLRLPTLEALGLGAAVQAASGLALPGWDAVPTGLWAAATEHSRGKDTPSGHWELAGLPVPWEWHYFPDTEPAFPPEISARVAEIAGTDGILGDCHDSGTAIIDRLGARHFETGWPICYTSADSVFQIAAHEETFGLDRLLALCETLAPDLHALRVGRVIARPFLGAPGSFARTANRRDFAIAPPQPVLMDWVKAAGLSVHAIGKIHDIFSGQGIDSVAKGPDTALMQALFEAVETCGPGLCFANFVEFDSLYGHRRDPEGYARALAWFDGEIARLLPRLRAGDLLILTADHGNDPIWTGTDHTRERVPVLIHGAGSGGAGLVDFVDVAATAAAHLGLVKRGPGVSILERISHAQ